MPARPPTSEPTPASSAGTPSSAGRILVPGRNCWRREGAERLAFFVDGASYFQAFRSAVAQAERSVLILGWDIDSRLRLVREQMSDDWPPTLRELLDEAVRRTPGLEIHVLCWDFAMIFAVSREWLPIYKLDWKTHRRLHFCLDDKLPVGACHHQKIVVVDDKTAFVGGLDLTSWRWDTPEHLPDHPGRCEADGDPYPPHHDVQVAVSGHVARALGELARERWFRATGECLRAPSPRQEHDPWPQGVAPDMKGIQAGIARTSPGYDGHAGVREIETLYLDAIRSAQRYIYIENQYLTARGVGQALARRLAEDDGPEVVIVLPCKASGWLEENTIYKLRANLVRQLRESDAHDRFRVYYPDIAGLDDRRINLHSKIMTVDDTFVRVGSANLSNRSMGMDTECDLGIEAQGDPAVREAIAAFRNRLLGEHLGAAPDAVARTLQKSGSLVGTVESLRGGARTLKVLEAPMPATGDTWLTAAELADPEKPMEPEEFVAEFVPEDEPEPPRRRLLKGVLAVVGLAAVVALWKWLPMEQWIDLDAVLDAGVGLKESEAGPLLVLAAFLIAGSIAAPLTPVVVVTVLAYDLVLGFAYSLASCLISSFLTYGVGHALGRAGVRRLAGKRLNRLSRYLAQRGFLAILAVRIVPVAPFTVVNLVAGASHIGFRDYALGSLLGMAPSLLVLSVLTDRLEATVQDPGLVSALAVLVMASIIVLGGLAARRWLLPKGEHGDSSEPQTHGRPE